MERKVETRRDLDPICDLFVMERSALVQTAPAGKTFTLQIQCETKCVS